MALITCPECAKEVSSAAAACPSCAFPITAPKPPPVAAARPPEKPGMGLFPKILIGIVGAVALFLIFGALSMTPADRERFDAQDAIKLCWTDQQRKSLDPSEQRFIAGACEMMENNYQQKYGRRP